MTGPPDEFAWIDRLRPLARGDPRALGLADDAAVIPGRPGFDLVVSKDAMVEGVHFPPGESPDIVARRLLRTSLSDLAAKAAEPFGYFLTTAWPADRGWSDRDAFIRGLAEDGAAFNVALLGGDTVKTPGPLVLSATVMGWSEAGRTLLRSGAQAGDLMVVCGWIGDGLMGLKAVHREVQDPSGRLAAHYRMPEPLFVLRQGLLGAAHAAADVSDGLVADAGHIAAASGLGLTLDLDQAPLSPEGRAWASGQKDVAAAWASLCVAGDDYAIICAIATANLEAFRSAIGSSGVPCAVVGSFDREAGRRIRWRGRSVDVGRAGWRH